MYLANEDDEDDDQIVLDRNNNVNIDPLQQI